MNVVSGGSKMGNYGPLGNIPPPLHLKHFNPSDLKSLESSKGNEVEEFAGAKGH